MGLDKYPDRKIASTTVTLKIKLEHIIYEIN